MADRNTFGRTLSKAPVLEWSIVKGDPKIPAMYPLDTSYSSPELGDRWNTHTY